MWSERQARVAPSPGSETSDLGTAMFGNEREGLTHNPRPRVRYWQERCREHRSHVPPAWCG